MSAQRQSRFVDLQIYVPAWVHVAPSVALPLFAVYEPIRLWLRARKVTAPFQKLLITLQDCTGVARLGRDVILALGIAEVDVAIDPRELESRAADRAWTLKIVREALGRVASELGWRSDALELRVEEMAQSSPPFVHTFEKLVRAKAGTVVEPWFSIAPDLMQIGVRISKAGSPPREVILLTMREPLYLEDEFPVAKSRWVGSDFLLMDTTGRELARVPIRDDSSGT